MLDQSIRRLLLAGAAVGFLFAGPALAQEECVQKLDQIEQRIDSADLTQEQRMIVVDSIVGARRLATSGTVLDCGQVVAELNELLPPQEDAGAVTASAADRDQPMSKDGQAEGDPVKQMVAADKTGDQAKSETEAVAVAAVAIEPKGDGTATGTNPFEVMPASELLGTEVVNERGDTVAEVVDLVKDGDTTYAVLSVGGFLGIGDKEVAMPLDRFEVDAEERVVLPGKTEDELEAMTAYDQAGYERVSELD